MSKSNKPFAERLNELSGALLLAAVLALFTNAIVAYAGNQVRDQRLANLEQFQQQQYLMNQSVQELTKIVAVLTERTTNMAEAIRK